MKKGKSYKKISFNLYSTIAMLIINDAQCVPSERENLATH